MKISTKGRYGLRIMLELALFYDKSLLTVRTIAQKQDISEKYIEQIISILNKAGLVRSQRGAAGGYRLNDDPDNITVGQVLRATEGGLNVVDCVDPTAPNCDRADQCVTRSVWIDVTKAIEDVVDHVTLANLVERHSQSQYTYFI